MNSKKINELNLINSYRIISISGDLWNFKAEFELRCNPNLIPNVLSAILLNATEIIYKNGTFNSQFNLSYYSQYIADDFDVKSNILLEVDILRQTEENLIAECYLYDKFSNKFLAKSFFVYAYQI